MARNVCNCIYFHIQEKTSKCVNLQACYWDVLGLNCNFGAIGRVENLKLTSKLNSTVTMTVLITQDFFQEYRNYSNERRIKCKNRTI